MNILKCILTPSLIFFCVIAQAGLAQAPIVFRSSHWSVARSIDTMTDEIHCTGLYKSTYDYQLTPEALYIYVDGGITSYKLRFDNLPPEPLSLPTNVEQKVGAFAITSESFISVLKSRRLRVQVTTLINGLVDLDISLEGSKAAHENILSGCPLPS